MTKKRYLICVVGATAVGKTSLAIALAKHLNAPVVSFDSRQFYCEIPIGTASPSKKEQAGVPHYFIGNKSIVENYSVGDYEREVIPLLDTLFSKGEFVVMVGGSGLYLNAILKGFDALPKIPSDVRIHLQNRLENEGLISLQKTLQKIDPISFERIAIQNPRRVLRALEVFEATGKTLSSLQKNTPKKRNFTPIKIGLEMPRELLYKRIENRTDTMINEGLLKEVESIYGHKNHNALQTVGYREIFQFLEGKIALPFAIAEIKKNTRRYAKRQLTWFRKDPEIHWFESGKTTVEKIINHYLFF